MIVLVTLYAFSLIGLALYGLHSLWLTTLYWRSTRSSCGGVDTSGTDGPRQSAQSDQRIALTCASGAAARRTAAPTGRWPRVTVQLPIFNERYTIARLVESVARLNYPHDRLEIQVLDDSTDVTTAIAGQVVAEYRRQGLDIILIHRDARPGFKAGALAAGLGRASGELIAVFDADFLPDPDWLKHIVREFDNPRLGCLQTRWTHLNRDYSLLTRAQALGVDGHFVVEQTARTRSELLLNFSGTAGVWRKACIEDAGGWHADTLTEDLDLSYRAQLRGWLVAYRPDVVVPAELPGQLDAFKRQQFRWAKGSLQTACKLLGAVWRAPLPPRTRLAAMIHLTNYAVHPLMLLTLLLSLPVGYWSGWLVDALPWFTVAAVGPPSMYALAETLHLPRVRDRLRVLPILILLGFGISLSNSVAAAEALLGRGSAFRRTPKSGLKGGDGSWADNAYALPRNPVVWGEIALAGYALVSLCLLWPRHSWAVAPWLFIYATGYLFVAGLSLLQGIERQQAHARVTLAADA